MKEVFSAGQVIASKTVGRKMQSLLALKINKKAQHTNFAVI
jgi:hypothetical protein